MSRLKYERESRESHLWFGSGWVEKGFGKMYTGRVQSFRIHLGFLGLNL